MDQGDINRHGPIDRTRAVMVLYHRGNVFDHLNREIHGDNIMKMLLRNMIKDSSMGTPITTVNKRIMVPPLRERPASQQGVVVFVLLAGMRAQTTSQRRCGVVTTRGGINLPGGSKFCLF